MTEIEKDIEVLKVRCTDLESQLHDIQLEDIKERNPSSINGRIMYIEGVLEKLSKTASALEDMLQKMNFDGKFIEIFTNEELRIFYKSSALSLPDFRAAISKILGKEITNQEAVQLCQGEVDDIRIRSKVGKFLRNSVK